MCAPSPPPAPDYAGAATAQGAANKEAAIASSRLNNPNVINPYGIQAWTENGTEGRPTLTQTFSPEQQALYEQSTRTKGLLGGLGEQGATALQNVVGRSLDISGVPAVGNYDSTRQKVIDASMARINEDYGKTTEQANSDLIAAGIRPGTKAYDDRMALLQRGRNDAYQQAELAGGNAAAQAFGMDTQARKDAIAEILAQRQTPLNEINALMSGSQVSNPFAVPGAAQNAGIQAAPLYNAALQTGQYNTDVYNAGVGQGNSMMNGLFSLGAAALKSPLIFSDRRLKKNVTRIGTHILGIGIYVWEYLWGERSIGVMADEVEEVMPEAVLMHPSGYKMVDYGMLNYGR